MRVCFYSENDIYIIYMIHVFVFSLWTLISASHGYTFSRLLYRWYDVRGLAVDGEFLSGFHS